MNNAPQLRPYQVEGLEFLRRHRRAFLADEMGLGKSAQIIRATEGRTLVVAPAMVLDGGTWSDELARWSDDPDRFQTVPYTSVCVRQGSRVLPELRPELDQHWDTLVLDEAHYIKNRKTSWTVQLLKLAKKADRVILATGTPIPNWSHEIFPALQMLRPERARPGGELGSYHRWLQTWFDCEPETIWVKGQEKKVPHIGGLLACNNTCWERPPTDPCAHHLEFVAGTLGDLFLQRLRDDVLTDLPPLTVQQIQTPMAPAQAKAYRTVKKEWLAELPNGDIKVAWGEGARQVMLDKVATGLEVLDPGLKGSGKLARLREDLADRGRPTLVVAHYRATVAASEGVARDLGLRVRSVHGGTSRKDRAEAVRLFKAGELDVLVGSLEVIAEGLTLTVADMVIFVEHSYKPSRNQQAVRRIHRLGQDRPCTMLDYVTPDTLDERKRELLASKTDAQVRTLTAAQLYTLA